MHLWNISFSSSENCLLGSIFSFDGQFALITPVSIAMTIFLEILPPAIRLLVTTSFTFTRNSSCKRFGLPFLLCKLALSFFLSFSLFFFQLFTGVLIKVYLGYFFPNFSSADFVPCIKAYSPTSFLMRSGTEML